jgi:membrane protein
MATVVSESAAARPRRRGRLAIVGSLVRTTIARAWQDRVLGLAAEAGFWQLLSLPSLLLGVLGLIGYFSCTLGHDNLLDLENSVVRGLKHVIVPSAVDSTVRPALHRILAGGRADVVSIGFVVSLWTGSSAMATFVNTITIAYGLRHQRGAVRSRVVALELYLAFVAVGVVLLPLLVLGPALIPKLFPDNTRHAVHVIVMIGYWPAVVLISLALLTSLYNFAIPVRTRWHRAIPGAVIALGIWLVGSVLLRMWLTWSFQSTSTYGPFSAPVAVLLFMYLTALAILLGAELNAEIDRLWPDQVTEQARRDDEAAAASAGQLTLPS